MIINSYFYTPPLGWNNLEQFITKRSFSQIINVNKKIDLDINNLEQKNPAPFWYGMEKY